MVYTLAYSRLKPVPLKSIACIQSHWLNANAVGPRSTLMLTKVPENHNPLNVK